MPLYEEAPETGNPHRERFLSQFEAWLDRRFEVAAGERRAHFAPDLDSVAAYAASIEPYRERFRAMLGWPLTQTRPDPPPAVREELVAEDDLGAIRRVWVEAVPGVELYGMLLVLPGGGRRPVVLTQHGGLGTPERIAGFFGSANYNDMLRRVLRRGAVAFAPQLFRWDAQFGRQPDVAALDRQMKQLGGSIAAFEIACLERALDYLVTRPEVDPGRIGMVGLSYGGFHTLYTAAADTRIRVALSSCFFNDRRRYGWSDWAFRDAALMFFDGEVAGLVCPRALYIEVGANDELLDVVSARPEVPRVAAWYEELGIPERFVYHEHPGKHEFDPGDAGLDFLFRHLRVV